MNLRWSIVAITASLCAAAAVISAAGERETRSVYRIPVSSLKMSTRLDGPDTYLAEFVGSAKLTGTLVIEFDRGPEISVENWDNEGSAFFKPDADSMKRLPAAIGNFYPKEPRVIDLHNSPQQLLGWFLPAKHVQTVMSGAAKNYEWKATLIISKFSTGVDCDSRYYSAEVTKVLVKAPELIAAANSPLRGC